MEKPNGAKLHPLLISELSALSEHLLHSVLLTAAQQLCLFSLLLLPRPQLELGPITDFGVPCNGVLEPSFASLIPLTPSGVFLLAFVLRHNVLKLVAGQWLRFLFFLAHHKVLFLLSFLVSLPCLSQGRWDVGDPEDSVRLLARLK